MRSESNLKNIVTNKNKNLLRPELWVDKHADYLFNYAQSRLNDMQIAKDLVQETFLSALEKAEGFRGDSSERTWLTAILKFKVIDIYRKKSSGLIVRPAIEMEEEDFFDPELNNWKCEHWPEHFGVEEHDPLHNKEFMAVLEKCMAKLPELWIAVFKLKHMDDESTAQICKELEITSSNYWVIIHRAKVNLRSCLQKNWI